MDYINLNSHRGIVNLLADYILKEITTGPEIESSIQVTNCGKFFLVNGLTNSETILDLGKIKMDFITEYKSLLSKFGYETINIVDTITYELDLKKKSEHSFTFYNTQRPIYDKTIFEFLDKDTDLNYQSMSNSGFIELDYSEDGTENLIDFNYSPLNISSDFPHGHSWGMGRGVLYYCEYLTNQIFNVTNTNKITFKYSEEKDEVDDLKIRIISNSIYPEKTIKSMVLDNFDFNLNVLRDTIKGYDVIKDITEPMGEKPWLIKDKKKGLIIF